MPEASGQGLPTVLRAYRRRYARLLLQHELLRRSYELDEALRVTTWEWENVCLVKDRWGQERTRQLHERLPKDKVLKRCRQPRSVGVWVALRGVAFDHAHTKTGRARALNDFCARYPLGKKPQTATISCREYHDALEAAIDLTYDAIVVSSEEHGLPLPSGVGKPRIPETSDEYDRICRVLRDEDPDPEEGVPGILDSVVLPPIHVSPTERQQKTSQEAEAATQKKGIAQFDVTLNGHLYRPLPQFADGHPDKVGDPTTFDAFRKFVSNRWDKVFARMSKEEQAKLRYVRPEWTPGKREPKNCWLLTWLETQLAEFLCSYRPRQA